jgi:hypothetical protein
VRLSSIADKFVPEKPMIAENEAQVQAGADYIGNQDSLKPFKVPLLSCKKSF